MMTVKELAKLAKVSPATISLVINNKKGVSDETRKRIKSLLKQYNYSLPIKSKVPLKNIRFLKYKEHGLIVDGNEGFISAIIDTIETECRNYGYNLSITTAEGAFEKALESVSQDSSDGLIILGTEINSKHYHLLDNIKIPFVVVDNIMYFEHCDCVVMNNRETVYYALKHLHDLGHREIAYFGSNVRISNFDERQDAFYHYCNQLGLTFSENNIYTVAPTLVGSYTSMQKIIEEGHDLPTAGFAENDTMAIGVIKALKENGYQIPKDISIIGFDDIPYCTMVNPPLTTMRVPKGKIGTLSVQRLCQRMQDFDCEDVKIQTGAELIVRGSTAPPHSK